MVKIITDSSSLYTVREGRSVGIESIPLSVSIGDWHGRDLQMDMASFYERIENGEIPSSSQPPIGEVLEAYKQYEEQPILNITMADGLSGTYETACSAREMSENHLQGKDLGIKHLLYISHANAMEDAANIKKRFRGVFPDLEIQILELSPAFVTQGGPKCVALQYIER